MSKLDHSHKYLLKKLLYQSSYRGCKETDLIIGRFAKKHLNNMTTEELLLFQNIINMQDADIYDWYMKKKPVPAEMQSEILSKLLESDPLEDVQ